MVEQILGEFENDTESLKLIPSGGGVFEVVVNDELVYSKKETGRHAEYEEVAVEIRKRLS
ncbi:MAG: SelT/SelW/SelH family protein [Acidimicrobiia bacterium]|jgi:selenoprotein W-related protein|nr:SelT/SelW/SelH family protein [Acidimicrobiia bacterium]